MHKGTSQIPVRDTSSGPRIETRPLHVEEWLDSLPYVDFRKTSRLLFEATRATNEQPLKAAVRLQLVELYNRPYQYYIDSQIRTGAQHTLQSIETMQDQIEILKQISVNLGFACKLAAEETLKTKTLWRQTKPQLPALLGSLRYLSHALIFSFLEYAPVPPGVWRQLHFIYQFAEGLDQQNATVVPPGTTAKKGATTISNAYKSIVMASLADPHHLPFGAIWEIYEQLGTWADRIEIRPLTDPEPAPGLFAVELESDARPVPLSKFKPGQPADRCRLVDAAALGRLVEAELESLNAGKPLGSDLQLSPYFARSVLKHVARAWTLPPDRTGPRKNREGAVRMVCGINAAWYFLNGEQDFQPPRQNEDEVTAEGETFDAEPDSAPAARYSSEVWNLVDQGPGGFAVIRNDKPEYTVRVGDVIGIRTSGRAWGVGVIRWLMIRQSRIYRMGVQILSANAAPAAIRALTGSQQDRRFRRALLLTNPRRPDEQSVVTERGLYLNRRQVEIRQGDTVRRMKAASLTEFSVAFEHFRIEPD